MAGAPCAIKGIAPRIEVRVHRRRVIRIVVIEVDW